MSAFSDDVKAYVGDQIVQALSKNDGRMTREEIGEVAIAALESQIAPTSPIRLLPFVERYEAVILASSREQAGVSKVVQVDPVDGNLWLCPHTFDIAWASTADGNKYVRKVSVTSILPPPQIAGQERLRIVRIPKNPPSNQISLGLDQDSISESVAGRISRSN